MCPTAESRDLLGVLGREVDAATASDLVLAVRVHGAGRLVYGLVDDVVLQLSGVGVGGGVLCNRKPPLFPNNEFYQYNEVGFCDTAMHYWRISKMSQ